MTKGPLLASFVSGAVVAVAAVTVLYRPTVAQEQTMATSVVDIRFDESMGGQRSLPIVPKSWRFVGASNGEKINATSLWFEDKDGQIYLITGFTTSRQFILDAAVRRLNRR